MNTLALSKQQLYLLVGSHTSSPMLELTTQIAINGPVRILDGSNSSNVHDLAHRLRRMIPQVYPALERIYIATAFTCYEIVSLVTHATPDRIPTLLPGLLATFYDEDVPLEEAQRLLRICLKALRTLCASQPIVISASPPNQHAADRLVLLEILLDASDRTISVQEDPETPKVETQLNLPF